MSSKHKSKGKGKDKATTSNLNSGTSSEWSNWEWNEGGYWECYRTHANGELEWLREGDNDSTLGSVTPRSEARNLNNCLPDDTEQDQTDTSTDYNNYYETTGTANSAPIYGNQVGSLVSNPPPYPLWFGSQHQSNIANLSQSIQNININPRLPMTPVIYEDPQQGITSSRILILTLLMSVTIGTSSAHQHTRHMPSVKKISRQYGAADSEKLDPRKKYLFILRKTLSKAHHRLLCDSDRDIQTVLETWTSFYDAVA
jgi:hypothetical protein